MVSMEKFVYVLLLLYKWCCCVRCHGDGEMDQSPVVAVGNKKLERVMLSIFLGSLTGVGCALVCGFLVRCILTCINTIPLVKGPVVFSPDISPKTLQSALSNQQTPNCTNNYYMTTLVENGLTIAVKKFEMIQAAQLQGTTGDNKKKVRRRIQRDLEILARLRHRHVMRLKAYVVDGGGDDDRFISLVYDYVATGSLEDAMKKSRENELELGWDARLRIAVGIIKGLDYLHNTSSPSVLHYNLKPSNVLLDADFEPRLADCGLLHTFGGGIITSSSASASEYYYYAPECFPNFSMYTEKSDIFSFGVILGMLLTGRDPRDALFGGDMGMWFRQQVVEAAGDGRDALDKTLLGEETQEDEMLMAVRIASVCLSHLPADRPSSNQLLPMLTQLHSF